MALQTKQTTQQRLMLAPNITLALEVLRMPTMELQMFLRQQVEENPLLEVEESYENEADAAPPETNGKESSSESQAGLDEEWLSHWKTGASEDDPNEELEGENRLLEQRLAKPESFHDSLRLQLGCQTLSETERRIGEALIHRLDENGYLEGSLEELAVELSVPVDQIEAVLKALQRFDPPGVGARDLRECLMIQLEYQNACGTLAYRILKDHFKLFVQHQLSAMAKATERTPQQVEEACASLKRLNPKPGRIFSGDLPPSLIPDLVIVQGEHHCDVELSDQSTPHVTINRTYYRMLKNPDTPEDAKEFLAAKFRKATWLMKAIEERNATLLSIGRCLISLQRNFVEHGQKALNPLTQSQVASLVGRHPSTISRAISGKTIDTPYGVFRLEELFASGVPQGHPGRHPAQSGNGEIAAGRQTDGSSSGTEPADISDAQIKSEIQRLITEEDARHPFSDEALAKQLAQRHVFVARRTIAKYRTHLKILPAHLRKLRF